MGGSAGKSKSDSNNDSKFQQQVWETQGDALGNLYNQLGGLFNKSYSGMRSQIPGAVDQQQGVFDAANPAWQQQLGGGAYQGMDLQNQYNQSLQGGGNEQFINQSIMGGDGNNYVQAMQDQMSRNSMDSLGRKLAMNDARAAGLGQSGSSRHGITESNIYDQADEGLFDAQTRLGYETFDKDLERKLGIAQRADQFDMGRLNNVSGMLGAQQGAMQGGLNFGQGMQNLGMGQFAPYMAPWQMSGQYASQMGAPTVLGYGSGSGSSDSKGFGGSGGKS